MRHRTRARSRLTPQGWIALVLALFWGVVASCGAYYLARLDHAAACREACK